MHLHIDTVANSDLTDDFAGLVIGRRWRRDGSQKCGKFLHTWPNSLRIIRINQYFMLTNFLICKNSAFIGVLIFF